MEILQNTAENKDQILSELLEANRLLQSQAEEQNHRITGLEKQLSWFKEQFKLSRHQKYASSSETAQSINLSLFDEVIPKDEIEPTPMEHGADSAAKKPRSKRSIGRHFDVSKFPKDERIYDLSESEKICGCGHQMEPAGEDRSIQVDHIPEQFKVIEHVSLKYCCHHCSTIKNAKKPETAIPKCMATPGFIAEVITKKYEQHLPLYRQSKIFEQLGADIPDNTLGNWVMRAAESLEPLRDASRAQLSSIRVMQSDETRVKTLNPNKEGYFWGYHSCDRGNRFVHFEYSPNRSAHLPNTLLKDFTGILQTDGYTGYNDLRSNPKIINVGCWDHCRRKFADVVKAGDVEKKGKAAQLITLMGHLYDIERGAHEMSFEERKAKRQQEAKPILDLIFTAAENINAPPKSLLGVAVTYLKNQWSQLIEYINHGEVEISNCWIENQIRPFAVGRRNWLFTGTPESANKAALLYSLIQTCHIHDIPARQYLEHVLNHAHDMRRGGVSPTSLLPQFIDKTIFN